MNTKLSVVLAAIIAATALESTADAADITSIPPAGTAPLQGFKTLPDRSHALFSGNFAPSNATSTGALSFKNAYPMQWAVINGVNYWVVKYAGEQNFALIRTDDLSRYTVAIPNQGTTSCSTAFHKTLEPQSWVRVPNSKPAQYTLQSVNCAQKTWASPTRMVVGGMSFRISKQYNSNSAPGGVGYYLADDKELLIPRLGQLQVLK
jgi:hypothetical protein